MKYSYNLLIERLERMNKVRKLKNKNLCAYIALSLLSLNVMTPIIYAAQETDSTPNAEAVDTSIKTPKEQSAMQKLLSQTIQSEMTNAILNNGDFSVDSIKETVKNYAVTEAAKTSLTGVFGKEAVSNFFDKGQLFGDGMKPDMGAIGVGVTYAAIMNALSGGNASDAAKAIATDWANNQINNSINDVLNNGTGGILDGNLSSGTLGGTSTGGGSVGGLGGDVIENVAEGLIPGIPVPNSQYATYKLEVDGEGKAFTTASVIMNPPNPLKKESEKFIVTIMSTGVPATASISYTPVVQTREKTYDEVGIYSEEFKFSYVYQPPCYGCHDGCCYPPKVYGNGKVTVSFRVEGTSSFGAGENRSSIYSDGSLSGDTDVMGGVGNGYSSGNLEYGYSNGGLRGEMNFGSKGENSLLSTNPIENLGDNLTNIISGDLKYPFGSLKELTNGFNNLSDSILKLVTGKSSTSQNSDDEAEKNAAIMEAAQKLQIDQTPNDVRKAKINSMQNLLSETSKYLSTQNIAPEDIPALYDNDSAYTKGRDNTIKYKSYGTAGWDMNRLTQFMVINPGDNINEVKSK